MADLITPITGFPFFDRKDNKAAKLLNRRAVLLIGSERNRPTEPLPEGIIAVNYALFGELLPRAAAMVHQGGAHAA